MIIPVHKIKDIGGGKAGGLAFLKNAGMKIPETWVVTGLDKAELERFIQKLPPKAYAIRSSAVGEDGTEFSFAGQFETYLNVQGEKEILEAVEKCFQSAKSMTVSTYKQELHAGGSTSMNVIIQEMVRPEISGVLFTADPVKNRHDRISISLLQGVGEHLMSGLESGETFSFYKHFKFLRDLPESKWISKHKLRELVELALEIEKKFGQAADLEWAIDVNGDIWWLQLRPVTSLKTVHVNELDSTPNYDNPVYTRGNIGEMMPGPVTPLTLSTFGVALEYGLQVFYTKVGAISDFTKKNIFVHSFYNHLFFDLKGLYNVAKKVKLSTKENIDLAIVGDIVPGDSVKMEVTNIKGWLNFIKVLKYTGSAVKSEKKLKYLYENFRIISSQDMKTCFEQINNNLEVLNTAYDLHYVTSSQSGSYFSAILNIYSKGKTPESAHVEKVSKLFTQIPDIESVQVVKAIDRLAEILARVPGIEFQFLEVPVEESLNFLENTENQSVNKAWAEFLERHGHRCVREAELREKEWALNTLPVVDGLKAKTQLLFNGVVKKLNGYAMEQMSFNKDNLGGFEKIIIRHLLPKARKAVARREKTKAYAIGVQYQFKKAYRHLAGLMVKRGLLTDEDQLFFLQHKEIGELLHSGDKQKWISIANERRMIYPELQQMSFADVSFGIPVPEEADNERENSELQGVPVSRGKVEGRVRLVSSMDDARLLREGEIMVARMTDIGWTPFYSVIAGLITEIGSPLSHGAVVAREYGLPAIVSMKGAMSGLQTGQMIHLDAIKGKVELL